MITNPVTGRRYPRNYFGAQIVKDLLELTVPLETLRDPSLDFVDRW